ncbi:membrane protein [Gallibacterium genomosp. 3]|uniref:Membrane protein n=1 Tax=Gallibacterium genomosp. 3 TaxID=505345 RepID=A0A1A7PPU3_9PAST|nr:VirK/YbjX family protein [Gallibacterium genomosp. 3]OBX04079.1 membrane protein [Gallibacterium genomosp. 3]
MSKYYQWPKANELYPNKGKKTYYLKRLRFRLRSLLHYSQIKKFEYIVNQNLLLTRLLANKPDWSYPLVYRFLDKRFSASERFELIVDNLSFLPRKLEELNFPPLWEKNINFGEIIPEYRLSLTSTTHQPMEGYWTLELHHIQSKELIYLLTFAKVKHALLIAVIQGPNCTGSKEIVKHLTKQCYGLRPAYLMIEIMKILTKALGYKQLLGIPQQYQNKSRFIKTKRYFVNYDTMFMESGGVLSEYWQLPIGIEQKDLNMIPSNKRSMYRKRYTLLEQIQQIIQKTLNIHSNEYERNH